jgi:tryptophan halogenase
MDALHHELLDQRLSAIIEALDGQHVEADEFELWFELADAPGLQVRLRIGPHGPCFDRSANFAISHGGQPTDGPIAPAFRDAVAHIKALDATVIENAAPAFAATAGAVAERWAAAAAAAALAREPAPAPTFPGSLRRVVVVGGGTAGYFAALALKHEWPALSVTLIESRKIPIIGVGEATTTLMPPFLHLQLGIDIVDLYRQLRPTWKMGIKFDWGLPGDYYFNYPFGDGNPVEAYAHDGHINNQSFCSLLMSADRAPIVIGDDGEPISLLPYMPYAYHLENKSFVAYLERCARAAGIHHIDAEIRDVVTSPDQTTVDRLMLDDGRTICADLYVDASGFRSLLMEQALGSPFISYASSLFCDTAVVAEVPQCGPIQPYTTAETMDAGWCWRIPVDGEDHRGYVFSSAHLSVEQAQAEMRARNPGMGDTWTVRFRSGRHESFWTGNTVAIGNAYGFVEPLESTALHMVIMELRCLIRCLRTAENDQWDRAFANESVAQHWDYLRWFLAMHYRFNGKSDSEFWRTCRDTVDISGIEPMLERFRRFGPVKEGGVSPHVIPDPVFNYHGVVTMLLGQHVPCRRPAGTWLSKAQWRARVAEARRLVSRALDQRQALDLLCARPEMLEHLVGPESPSWIVASTPAAEYVKVPGFWVEALRGTPDTTSDDVERQPKEEVVPFHDILGSIAPPADNGHAWGAFRPTYLPARGASGPPQQPTSGQWWPMSGQGDRPSQAPPSRKSLS